MRLLHNSHTMPTADYSFSQDRSSGKERDRHVGGDIVGVFPDYVLGRATSTVGERKNQWSFCSP